MTKKIVVTGIGASSPLGGTAPESWASLLAGESGVRSLTHEWVLQYELPVTFAAEAKVRPETVLTRQETKRLDPSSQFALISAREDVSIPPETVLFGEISLSGALRPVSQTENRLKEAAKLGFSQAIAPKGSKLGQVEGMNVRQMPDLTAFVGEMFGAG